MSWFFRFLTSSIGKKLQMAATGLLLCGFLVAHLAGNLLLYKGPDAFNHYARSLESNVLLPFAEIGLLLLFLVHILTALRLSWENKKARPAPYAQGRWAGGKTWGSATMLASGFLILVFLILHVKAFRFAPESEEGDLFRLVTSTLARKGWSVFYAAAMAALALHLSHGFQGGFQTFGVNHPRYTPAIKAAGWAFAVLICAGFASIAVWAGFVR